MLKVEIVTSFKTRNFNLSEFTFAYDWIVHTGQRQDFEHLKSEGNTNSLTDTILKTIVFMKTFLFLMN